MKIGGGNIMNQPIKQHIVPRVYLKNFSIKKKESVWNLRFRKKES